MMQGFSGILPDFLAPSQRLIRLKALMAKGFGFVQQALTIKTLVRKS
jgi:hypothetical protein